MSDESKPLKVTPDLKRGLIDLLAELEREARTQNGQLTKLTGQYAIWLQRDETFPDPRSKELLERAKIVKEFSDAVSAIRSLVHADMTISGEQPGSARWGLDRLLHGNNNDAAHAHNDYHMPKFVEDHQDELEGLLISLGGPLLSQRPKKPEIHSRT